MKTLEVVVGAQFGSEGKGHVTQRLTQRALQTEGQMVQVVRVAGPNAGHTAYDANGARWALRQVPIAVVVPDDRVILGIAAGSEIDPQVLLDEIDQLREAGVLGGKQLWVSGDATVITERDKTEEKKLIEKIGSTGKGIGAARARRIMRKADRVQDDEKLVTALGERGIIIANHNTRPTTIIADAHTIIEGTQGYGLGLHTNHYPKSTSSNCRACDFMAMAGVHAWEFESVEVWAVARIYPIRVAGDSGNLHREVSWADLGLPEEQTTVTKKTRRVGMPDWTLVQEAVAANGGSPTVKVALTMFDQMFPVYKDRPWGDPDQDVDGWEGKVDDAHTYLVGVQGRVGAKIGLVTTGPDTYSFIND